MTIPTPMLRALCAVLALASLAGCQMLKHDEDVSAVVNRRAVGMAAGDFFDRFGSAGRALDQGDGSAQYDWVSSVGYALPGPAGQDERICRLKVSVDNKGRVSAVQIIYDAQGRTSTSRCGEIFAAP